MEKIHLVVGQNNVGKSNALHVAADFLGTLRTSGGRLTAEMIMPGSFDIPEDWPASEPITVSLGLRLNDAVKTSLHYDNPIVQAWLQTKAYTHGDAEVVWIDLELARDPQQPSNYIPRLSARQIQAAEAEPGQFVSGHLAAISMAVSSGSGDQAFNMQNILSRWSPWQWIPETVWVDAVRQITAQGDENLRSGTGIISRLAALERPSRLNYAADRAQFESLESFVRDVLEDDQVRIEIPDQRNTIHIHGRTGMRELGDLGTGVHELVFIALVASINQGALVCIEEPEIHLHPTLQRKLIDYLNRETSNNYLISTHSAPMLNADVATITHIAMPEKWSVASPVITPGDLARVASDLGNRASDIVQSNFVIWVEGPSDRLYIRRWLELLDPELLEGGHYSIMFYGGALLSNLTADDDEVDDFINLLRISRHLAVVIDSDKSSATDTLNATKTRVLAELGRLNAPAWVTDGYTIENYLGRSQLTDALASLYPTQTYSLPRGNFAAPLGKKFQGTESKPSKTTVARYVVAQPSELSDYSADLRTHIEELSRAIRSANGLLVRGTD